MGHRNTVNAADIPNLVAHFMATNRDRYAGWRMADDSADDGDADSSTEDESQGAEGDASEGDGDADGGDDSNASDEVSDYADLKAIADELGLKPGQIAGRLLASKKWEQRAKQANGATEPEPLTADEVREQVRTELQEQHQADLAETAIRSRLEARGIEGEAIENVVATLNAGVRGVLTDGRVDADKANALVGLLAPNPEWPDMGQGNRGGSSEATGLEAGRSAYASRRGKK